MPTPRINETPVSHQVALTSRYEDKPEAALGLIVFATDVPFMIAFTTARYQEVTT